MQERLLDEIGALGRRANLNLYLGFIISIFGLSALGWFVVQTGEELKSDGASLATAEIVIKFIIRLSLVVFIEVFAYFFLRLYRYALFEIKYFQNEITGAQFRLIALEAALRNGDVGAMEKICAEMSKSERNFLLKKGETTIELRREHDESSRDPRLWSLFETIVRDRTINKS